MLLESFLRACNGRDNAAQNAELLLDGVQRTLRLDSQGRASVELPLKQFFLDWAGQDVPACALACSCRRQNTELMTCFSLLKTRYASKHCCIGVYITIMDHFRVNSLHQCADGISTKLDGLVFLVLVSGAVSGLGVLDGMF